MIGEPLMRTDKLALLAVSIAIILPFITSIRKGWAGTFYEKKKDAWWAWFWLDLFHCQRTRENWVRFSNVASWFAIALIATGTIVLMLFG